MKLLVCLAVMSLAFVGCQKIETTEDYLARQQIESKNCTLERNGIRQAVKNNWVYRADIKADYRACMSGNSNRDVVYNDTNELAKTCIESAHKLNGGVVANDWNGPTTAFIAKVEKSLRDCGEI